MWVAQGWRFGLILGAAFMRQHNSALFSRKKDGSNRHRSQQESYSYRAMPIKTKSSTALSRGGRRATIVNHVGGCKYRT